jgi:hypothetical protein
MSCCAAGTESAAELEALKSDGPSAEEMWLSSRVLGNGMRQVDLIVPGVHCGACIALLEKELPKAGCRSCPGQSLDPAGVGGVRAIPGWQWRPMPRPCSRSE